METQAPSALQLLSFDGLAQRVLAQYAFTFADFAPVATDAASLPAQRAFHALCGALVRGVAADPALLGLPTDVLDEWLGPHQTLSMRPALYKVRNTCQKAFESLCGLLYAAGLHGARQDGRLIVPKARLPKLTAKALATCTDLLSRLGYAAEMGEDALSFRFPEQPEILDAWQALALACARDPGSPNSQALRFALWLHADDPGFFLERVCQLLGLEADFFAQVARRYEAKGYAVRFFIDGYRTTCAFTRAASGLNIEYATLWPTVRFVNTTSIGIKAILEDADALDAAFRRQLVWFCKPCNDCLGCTKGGKNKQFTVPVDADGQAHRLCPEFVQMEWYNRDISLEKIDFLLALGELQAQYGKRR